MRIITAIRGSLGNARVVYENVLGEHRSTTPLALELSKVLLYSVQNCFWFPVLFLIAYLHRHMGSPKERSLFIFVQLVAHAPDTHQGPKQLKKYPFF